MKSLYKIKAIILACLLVFATTSCDKDFDLVNTNPTQAADVDPGFQLSYAQEFLSQNRYEHWRTNFILTSCFIQHTAQTAGYFEGDKYSYGIPSYNASLFDVAYTREIKNLVDLIERTSGDPAYENTRNVARIVKAYAFSRLTDLYGDVPYSEAGRGFYDRNFFPKYDTQQAIYDDMLKEVTEAGAALNAAGAAVRGDIFFGGDIDKWKKAANSLRLRFGMRLSKVDAAKAQSEVSAAIAGGVMTELSDGLVMPHTLDRSNGNSDVFNADKGMRLSEAFVNHMKSTGDPRLPIYGAIYMDDANWALYPIPNGELADDPSAPGGLKKVVDATTGANIVSNFMTDPTGIDGLPNGTNFADLGDGEKNRFVHPNYTTLLPQSVPYIHMGYAEVEFLLAEAAVRGWGATDAEGHFSKALEASVRQMDIFPGEASAIVGAADVAGYVAANGTLSGSDADKLMKIGTFLWGSLYLDGYEAFASWRRTGAPDLTPVNHPNGVTNGTIPRRCHYPQSESGLNADNYKAAVGNLSNGDSYTSRVWWDQ